MKHVFVVFILTAATLNVLAQSNAVASQAKEVSLTLNISNLSSTTSMLYVGFYTVDNDFPKQGQHHFAKVIQPNTKEISQTWDDIPAGEYAIAIYQDLDDNQELNTNWMGMPKEPYGFSTNFQAGMFNLPNFKKCKINISMEQNEHSIALIN